MDIGQTAALAEAVAESVKSVVVCGDGLIGLLLSAVLAGGHVLLDDLPGTGKTTLAKSLAVSLGVTFKRVQFTPDLLPSDLTGINYFNQKESEFVFREGPVFAGLVLADEINRATPRTQSALLECMEERQVTIDGVTRAMPEPFLVIATQNPVETSGTFPLPEAQLDRFLMRLSIGYPSPEDGARILSRFHTGDPLGGLRAVTRPERLTEAKACVRGVTVVDDVKAYVVAIAEATRAHERVALGASPRAALALMRAAQAYAAVQARDFVTPDDVKAVAAPVLAHRLILKGHTAAAASRAAEVVGDVLNRVETPTIDR